MRRTITLYTLPRLIIILAVLVLITGTRGFYYAHDIKSLYMQRASPLIHDRNGEIIAIVPNSHNYYAYYTGNTPQIVKDVLLRKEDRYFYFHPGINPVSMIKSVSKDRNASSTITLQLAKVLLGNESDRSWHNKLREIYTAITLEAFTSKDDILTMYSNTIFLGNGAQGLATASKQYYNKPLEDLSRDEAILLLAGISEPSTINPFAPDHFEYATALKNQLYPHSSPIDPSQGKSTADISSQRADFLDYVRSPSYFEISDLLPGLATDAQNTTLTIDAKLTDTVRAITYRNIQDLFSRNAFNAAVVVIDLHTNSVLALVGTPDLSVKDSGYQINMTNKPRQIGSTIKPFIYAAGFDMGLSPNSLIDDKELKYTIGSGYALYPKNFDYTYSGTTTLYHALSNSLNTPTVQVLDHIGVENFSSLLQNRIHIDAQQSLDNYQLGLALGELEISILDLAHAFSVFPHEGVLAPLHISDSQTVSQTIGLDVPTGQDPVFSTTSVADINTILSDRLAGVDQFGSKNNLSLPYDSYAVKTGTTDNFRDSLTVGYTKDFLVAVWVGNTTQEPMQGVSGQIGAGAIWHDVMTHLLSGSYNRQGKLTINPQLRTVATTQNTVTTDSTLILAPHNGDRFLLEDSTEISLQSSADVRWFANEIYLGRGSEIFFHPEIADPYTITARSTDDPRQESSITLYVNSP